MFRIAAPRSRGTKIDRCRIAIPTKRTSSEPRPSGAVSTGEQKLPNEPNSDATIGSGHFRRRNRLPNMPLRMLRNMRQQSGDSSRQPLPSNFPHLPQNPRINSPHHRLSPQESPIQLRQKLLPRSPRLPIPQLHRKPPDQIPDQPLRTPRNMPYMKPHLRRP